MCQRKVQIIIRLLDSRTKCLAVALQRFFVRSDNEPAVLALMESAATALKLASVTVRIQESDLYDSQSNGLAERAVKDVKDAVRTNLACLVWRRTGVRRRTSSPALACETLWRGSRRQDTLRTAQRAQVRASTAAFCGERSLESRKGWRELNQLGTTESTLVCLIGVTTSTWCHRESHGADTQAPRSYRASCLRFPECCVGKDLGMAPRTRKTCRVVLPDGSSPAVMAEAEAIGKTRRLYINQADMKKHGFTEGCLGCRSFAAGKRAQGHFEGCPCTTRSRSHQNRTMGESA